MRCVYCMNDISVAATVCPHCHRSAKASGQANTKFWLCTVIAAFIGYALGGLLGLIVGAILGAIVGGVVMYAFTDTTDPGANVRRLD